MKTIFVTGAAGWLGVSLCKYIIKNSTHKLQALCLNSEEEKFLRARVPEAETLVGDLRDPQTSQRFLKNAAAGDYVIHCAGIIHPQKVSDFFAINFEGATHLINAVLQHGDKNLRTVLVSSNSPMGTNPYQDHLFTEEDPYHPYMGYGTSKMMMEQYALEKIKTNAFNGVIIRAPWFYGPDQPARQTLFFKMIAGGKFPIVGSGNNLRSMAFTENLSQGLVLAAETESARGNIYWIADRRPYSMNEIVDTVETLLRDEFKIPCKGSRMRLPSFASDIAYVADKSLQALGVYQQKIHVLSEMNKTIACSVAKAERDLGYNPEIELKEGMRRSIQWCIEQKLL